jgi:hypothetical protein
LSLPNQDSARCGGRTAEGDVSLPARIATPPLLLLREEERKVVAGEDEVTRPDVWRRLKEIADRARAEGQTTERTRVAIAAVCALTPEMDETDKPAA